MILIIGGENDQEILWIQKVFKLYNKINILTILLGPNNLHSINWDVNNDLLYINQKIIKPKSVFLRQNVFSKNHNYQLQSRRWHHVMQGWTLCHPEVKVLNRNWLTRFSNKTYNLFIAKKVGFNIPNTKITNNISLIKKQLENNDFILKPIDNGFCYNAEEAIKNCKTKKIKNIEISSTPAFFQKKIIKDEYRIYWIIDDYWIFKLNSNSLDHRIKQDATVELCDKKLFSQDLINKIKRMVNYLVLDYSAIDFKFDGNKIYFLEINDFPMFSYFDKVSNYKLSNRIFKFLK